MIANLERTRSWLIRELSNLLGVRYLQSRLAEDLERSEKLARRLGRNSEPSSNNGSQIRDQQQDATVNRGSEDRVENSSTESEAALRPSKDRVYQQAALARSLRFKYKFHNGTVEDLDEAANILERALKDAKNVIGFSQTEYATMVNDWGLLMRARSAERGGQDDLDAGILVMELFLEHHGELSSA